MQFWSSDFQNGRHKIDSAYIFSIGIRENSPFYQIISGKKVQNFFEYQYCSVERISLIRKNLQVCTNFLQTYFFLRVAHCLREALQEEEREATKVEVCHPNFCDEDGDIII